MTDKEIIIDGEREKVNILFECNHIEDIEAFDMIKQGIEITPQNAPIGDFKIKIISNIHSPYGFSSICSKSKKSEDWEYMGLGHSGACSIVTALLKELSIKTAECEELFAKTYQMWMYYIANGINNASDLNIQHLLEDLGKITKMLAELCNIKDSTLSYYAGQALDETNRYRKALEEIEELVKSLNENRMCFYDDVNDCSNCDMNTDCNYLRKFKILDIISKAKGGEDEHN